LVEIGFNILPRIVWLLREQRKNRKTCASPANAVPKSLLNLDNCATYGAHFIDSLIEARGTTEAIRLLSRHPPKKLEEVLLPELYLKEIARRELPALGTATATI